MTYLREEDKDMIYSKEEVDGGYRITFNTSTTSIDSTCLTDKKDIVEMIIPVSVEYIDDNAFDGCINLSKVTIPKRFPFEKLDILFKDCNISIIERIQEESKND